MGCVRVIRGLLCVKLGVGGAVASGVVAVEEEEVGNQDAVGFSVIGAKSFLNQLPSVLLGCLSYCR